MSTAAPLQNTAAKSLLVGKSPHTGLLMQRKCACGGSASSSLSGECAECSKKKLQRKLSIGASNDPLEQEADRVADQVLAAPAHSAVSGTTPSIQRFTGHSTADATTAPPSIDRVLSSSGRPLDKALQQDMGQRFGHDFSRVRVHTGAAAEQSARDVNAQAYTVGHNIVFGKGQLTPESYNGRHLIAHELTHVLQQSRSEGIQRQLADDRVSAGPDQTTESGHGSVELDSPNRAPSCDEICGEKEKCLREPGEHCTDDNSKAIFEAWGKASKEMVDAINHLTNTPTSPSATQSLKNNFAWDGKTPVDLPKKVADKLQEALDKMSENLCIKCRQTCAKGNPAQIVQARGQNCLGHNCFVICPDFFSASNKSHILLHELLHRVVSGKAQMDLYRGQPGYPGGTSVALTMPDPYASVVDDLASSTKASPP